MSYPAIAREDLRDVALSAHAALLIESARIYGLMAGGYDVDIDRCDEVIADAEAAGHTYVQEEIESRALDLCAGMNMEIAEAVRNRTAAESESCG